MVALSAEHSTHFLSCDWGTSSLRLFLVNSDTREVIDSIASNDGVKKVNEQVAPSADRKSVFKTVLEKHIRQLVSRTNQDLDGLTIVASGMVSSSIGWVELPYASLPFSVDGVDINTHMIPSDDTFHHDVFVISGVRDGQKDIMRGEETQMIGLACQMDPMDGWYVFPGTHSKHLLLKNREITEFKTYMTGELFALMAEHSILNNTIELTSTFDEEAFRKGVGMGASENLLHAFFTLRSKSVISGSQILSDHLSGLLIGHELADIRMLREKVIICSTTNMKDRYSIALNHLRPDDENQVIETSIIDRAVPQAHLKLLKQLKNTG